MARDKMIGPRLPGGKFYKNKPEAKKNLVTLIKSVVTKAGEKKMVTDYLPASIGNNMTVFNATVNSTADYYPVIPAISQGVGENQRVGNRITPTSCYMDLVVSIRCDTATSAHITPRVFVVSDKSVKSQSLQAEINFTSLLDGGGSPQSYLADLKSALTPLNTLQFTKHHDKQFMLAKTYATGPTLANINVGDQYDVSSVITRRMRLKIPLPKTLLYDNNLDIWPSNAAVWFAIGFTNMTNTNEASALLPLLAVSYATTIHYTDA